MADLLSHLVLYPTTGHASDSTDSIGAASGASGAQLDVAKGMIQHDDVDLEDRIYKTIERIGGHAAEFDAQLRQLRDTHVSTDVSALSTDPTPMHTVTSAPTAPPSLSADACSKDVVQHLQRHVRVPIVSDDEDDEDDDDDDDDDNEVGDGHGRGHNDGAFRNAASDSPRQRPRAVRPVLAGARLPGFPRARLPGFPSSGEQRHEKNRVAPHDSTTSRSHLIVHPVARGRNAHPGASIARQDASGEQVPQSADHEQLQASPFDKSTGSRVPPQGSPRANCTPDVSMAVPVGCVPSHALLDDPIDDGVHTSSTSITSAAAARSADDLSMTLTTHSSRHTQRARRKSQGTAATSAASSTRSAATTTSRMTRADTAKTLEGFAVGAKLEAEDHDGLLCVATITNIDLVGRRIRVGFDGWRDTHSYWVALADEDGLTRLHPIGWCAEHGEELDPPRDFRGVFDWTAYLDRTGAKAVPVSTLSTALVRSRGGVGGSSSTRKIDATVNANNDRDTYDGTSAKGLASVPTPPPSRSHSAAEDTALRTTRHHRRGGEQDARAVVNEAGDEACLSGPEDGMISVKQYGAAEKTPPSATRRTSSARSKRRDSERGSSADRTVPPHTRASGELSAHGLMRGMKLEAEDISFKGSEP